VPTHDRFTVIRAELGVQLKSLKATRKHLVETGNAQSSEIQEIETKLMSTGHTRKRTRKMHSKLMNSITK